MRWLYPHFPPGHLPMMLRISLLGAVVAAIYGGAHDQLSFALSPEYFTKFKVRQFAWADVGWPPQVFASVIGVLATWWVGLLAGWFLSRIGLVKLSPPLRRKTMWRAFAIVAVTAIFGGFIGWTIGTRTDDLSGWNLWQQKLSIEDLPAFVVVAYLHAGGYIGAGVGLAAAIVYVRRCVVQNQNISEST